MVRLHKRVLAQSRSLGPRSTEFRALQGDLTGFQHKNVQYTWELF